MATTTDCIYMSTRILPHICKTHVCPEKHHTNQNSQSNKMADSKRTPGPLAAKFAEAIMERRGLNSDTKHTCDAIVQRLNDVSDSMRSNHEGLMQQLDRGFDEIKATLAESRYWAGRLLQMLKERERREARERRGSGVGM